MTADSGDPRSTGRRVAATMLRVLAVLGAIGACGWIALWLAFTL